MRPRDSVYKVKPERAESRNNINGRRLSNFRFADDIVIFANSPSELERMITELSTRSRSGRPSTSTNENSIARVQGMVLVDRRITVSEVASTSHIGRAQAHHMLHDVLDHTIRYAREGNEFLFRVVTGVETWVDHFTPETKAASMTWKHPTSPVKKTFKVTSSAGKSNMLKYLRSNFTRHLAMESLAPSLPARGAHLAEQLDCSGRQHSLKWVKGKRSRPVCPVVQQEEIESIPASRYECTIVWTLAPFQVLEHKIVNTRNILSRTTTVIPADFFLWGLEVPQGRIAPNTFCYHRGIEEPYQN
ncbi:hypothetical protein ANN_17757 [Periplaneta americana]|uniref:Reverse transcriptase domain-containing protein n=1 Tax=Periplaneta americana TaxID=6978 RepID=A0ABQ8SVD0_PERAM|nr:hypothetical protein ANN_17757 [Periplaneta americana]